MGFPGMQQQVFVQRFRVQPAAASRISDSSHLEAGGKIILPTSALTALAQMQVAYPMLFRVSYKGRSVHCGVLEFSADEGLVFMPHWMMENLTVDMNELVQVENVTLPKGTFVKFRPQTKDFLDVSNPRAVLENSLRHFAALGEGETIRIAYNKRNYDIDIVEAKPNKAICCVDTDINVDFDAPADYQSPPRERPPTPTRPLFDQLKRGEDDDKPFGGVGRRLKNGRSTGESTGTAEEESAVSWRLVFPRWGGMQPLTKEEAAAEGMDVGDDSSGFQAFGGSGQKAKRGKR